MYVCLCNGITDKQLAEAAVRVARECRSGGPRLVGELVADQMGVGLVCGLCREFAVGLVEDAIAGRNGIAAAD